MPLQIYNTLSRRKEIFESVHPDRIGVYFCGPTVYGDAHVGHAKAYITADIVNRYLRFRFPEKKVTYVQNITDVGHLTDDADEGEDKLQVQGRKEKKHPMEIAEYYTRRYFEDMDALNILRPDISPRATGHIIEQIELIKELIEKGFAYEANGNVYFDVSKDKEYGKLSGRKVEDQEASGRVEERSDKRSPQDFALWKRAEKNHILQWPSPWGVGFPGWHIECSAMSMKYLGESFDIHGGGLENQFPHHECEIAQSECGTGVKPFVKYWMHNNMVTTGGVKMGKSLGNSAYLRDLFQKYDPLSLRFTILQSHYRGTTEFTEEAITSADAGYQRLLRAYGLVSGNNADKFSSPINSLVNDEIKKIENAIIEAMDDDFNTAKAIASLYQLTTLSYENQSFGNEAFVLQQAWQKFAGDILGILPTRESTSSDASSALESSMQILIHQRKAARDRRDFAASDAIRKELDEAGIVLEDSKEGTTWRLK
ncbi:MAG TPA: cysteine--tRNA ligase [Candidatus Kapabacteria bacterium]|jgi:cysteinyl-tRNA synthetase